MAEQIGFVFDVKTNEADQKVKSLEASLKQLEKEIVSVSKVNDRLVNSNERLRMQMTGAAAAARELKEQKRALNAQARESEKQWRNLSSGIQSGALAFVAAGAAIRLALEPALQFETRMAEIQTIARGSSFSVGALSTASKELAFQFGTTASEQAAGLYEAISSGAASSRDAVQLLTAANGLAVGGLTDVKTAVDGLTSILNAYNLSGADATTVTDAMFVAIEKGKLKAEDLARNFGVLAPIANQVGISFQDAMAGVAAITTQGIQADTAIRGLRQALVNTIKPTKEASELAKSLGIEFSAAAIKAKGFPAFLRDVIEKTGGSSAALSILFSDVDGFNAVAALASEGGMKQFTSALDAMADSAERTAEANAIMADTGSKAIGRLTGAFDRFLIAAGDMAPVIGAVDGLGNAFNNFALVLENGWPSMQKWLNAIQNLTSRDLAAVVGSSGILAPAIIANRLGEQSDIQIEELAESQVDTGVQHGPFQETPEARRMRLRKAEADRKAEALKNRERTGRTPRTRLDAGFGLGTGLTDFFMEQQRINTELQNDNNRRAEFLFSQQEETALAERRAVEERAARQEEMDARAVELEDRIAALRLRGLNGPARVEFLRGQMQRAAVGGASDLELEARRLDLQEAEGSLVEQNKARADALGMSISNAMIGGIRGAKNFGDAVVRVFETLAFQAGANLLGKGIGAIIGSIIPGGGILADIFGANGGRIPHFASAGVVGGRATGLGIGRDNTLAMVQSGEAILSRPMTKALADTLGVRQSAPPAQQQQSAGPTTIVVQSMGEVSRQDAQRIAQTRLQPAFERNERNRTRTTVFDRTPNRK